MSAVHGNMKQHLVDQNKSLKLIKKDVGSIMNKDLKIQTMHADKV